MLARQLRLALAQTDRGGLLPGDLVEGDSGAGMPAAVLVAITRRTDPGVIFTRRRDHLRTHAGQIAFPGGRIDPGDHDASAAALREAHEELGLPSHEVTLWGTADRYRTVTGFDVVPVIGEIPPDLPLCPHEDEVADWFEAPLAFLLDPANQRAVEADFEGRMRTYYQINWQDRRIWGATAAMLVNLTRRLQWT